MRRKLTARFVETLPPAKDRRYEAWDEILSGFGVRVSANGRRAWFVVGRVNGVQHRHTIGTYPAVSLADAREAARQVLGQMQLGQYGLAHGDNERQTLGQIIPLFIERHARPKNKSWRQSETMLKRFASINTKPLADIRRADIARVLDDIICSGAPYQANRALAAIKTLFSWATDRGVVEYNPIVGMKPPTKETARDRILDDEEVRSLWRDWCSSSFPFGPIFKVLLLTGQRRDEVAAMRWSELDLGNANWRIPAERVKNARPHQVPLSLTVVEILRSIPHFQGSDFVFTTTGRSPVSGFGHCKARMDRRLLIPAWRIHDLRRTAASGMARLGVLPHVIEKVLNHVSGQISGVAAVYNRHEYADEKRSALNAWADALIDLCGHDSDEPPQDDINVAGTRVVRNSFDRGPRSIWPGLAA